MKLLKQILNQDLIQELKISQDLLDQAVLKVKWLIMIVILQCLHLDIQRSKRQIRGQGHPKNLASSYMALDASNKFAKQGLLSLLAGCQTTTIKNEHFAQKLIKSEN